MLEQGEPQRSRAQLMTRYLVPDECTRCRTAAAVELTVRTPRGAVALFWWCRRCRDVWPITPGPNTAERRGGLTDRRRWTRADRRKRLEE